MIVAFNDNEIQRKVAHRLLLQRDRKFTLRSRADEPKGVTGGQWQISTRGGTSPRWRPGGPAGNAGRYELYYIAPDNKLIAVAVSGSGATFLPGTPETLFQTHIAPGINRQNYDVARDGRFLIDTDLDDTSTEPIHLLLNWRPPAK